MMNNKKLYPAIVVLLFVGMMACKKDLNFNKFNDVKLSPEYGIPLVDFNLKISDAVKEDDVIKYDPDGFIRLVYVDDSLGNFPADSFVKIPSLSPITFFSNLGAIEVGNLNIVNSRTLSNIAGGFNPATQAALNSASGNVTIFPAINDQNTTVVALPNQTNANFVDVTMSQGFLKIEVQNRLPVTLDQLTINLYNLIPFQNLLGQIVLTGIGPNQSKADSINMNGKTLSTSIGYNMPVFKTLASSSPVLVDLSDSITVIATTSNLKAVAGNAVFPSQDLNTEDIIVPVKPEDTTARVKHAIFDQAFINYNVTSTVNERIDLHISIPGAKQNGVQIAPFIITVNNNTVTGSLDISNTDLDLGLVPGNPYNQLKVLIQPKIVSSNQIKTFDSSDFIDATFSFSNFKFKSLDGYLGSKTISFEPSDLLFDAFGNLTSGLRFEDLRIRINTQSSIGMPIRVNLNAVAQNPKGTTSTFNGSGFNISYPTMSQRGQTISDSYEYNKNNSNIVDVVAIAPNKITFGGTTITNANGFTNSYNDFIDKNTAINVGIEFEVPFNIRSDNIELQDTLTYPFMEVDAENKKFSDSSVLNLSFKDIDYLEVLTKIDNAFPFDGGFTLYFADENYQIKDSISVPVFFESAIPDANGRTQTRKVTNSGFKITSDQFRKHYQQNLIYMLISAKLNTYNNGTVPVKIYNNYNARIGLSGKVKANISTKKE